MTLDNLPSRKPAELLAELAQCEFDVVRLRAVQALRDTGAKDQAAALLAALDDEDEDVREDAAGALGALGIGAARAPLMQHLIEDPCGEVKLAALKSLGQLGAAEAAPYLRKLATGRSEDMDWGDEDLHYDEWDDWLDMQLAAIEALGNLRDEAAIEPIMTAVYDEEGQETGPVATRALAQIGAAALPSLGVLQKSSRRRLRLHALTALVSMERGADMAQMLVNSLDDEDAGIRLLAFGALLDTHFSQELLEKALIDPSPKIRIAGFAQLDLDDDMLLDRIRFDPAGEVQLAMIDRLDISVPAQSEDDRRITVLEALAEQGQGEVAARAFAALAAIGTERAKTRLAALFSGDNEEAETMADETERSQWAVADALARAAQPEGVEWLQRAARSPFRAVRLKALVALGKALQDGATPEVSKQQIRELLLSFTLPPVPADLMEPPKPEELQDDRKAIAAQGLDISTEVNPETGPTSSLGAILGHDDIAREITEEAEAEETAELLTAEEQRLLSRATRNLSRRKVSLDHDPESLDRGTRLTALNLMGHIEGQQGLLAGLLQDRDALVSAAAAKALEANITRFGSGLEPATLREATLFLMAGQDAGQRQSGLQILSQTALEDGQQQMLLRRLLKDGSPFVRKAALDCCARHGMLGREAERMTADPSPMVRLHALALVAEGNPEEAADRVMGFLKENPGELSASLLSCCPADSLEPRLTASLQDRDQRRFWPVMISALALRAA